jgi:broad specificity phosphatase PhoE
LFTKFLSCFIFFLLLLPQEPGWSEKALRPQDTPLSARGVHQAKRLGKWLYGRLPLHAPTAIFCSPFIRCVQTADAIAAELEGLQVFKNTRPTLKQTKQTRQ